MASLASLTDFTNFLPRSLDTSEQTRAQLCLDLISAHIRTVTGQLFDRVTGDSVTFWPRAEQTLMLPQAPVVQVNSVTEASTVLVADDGTGSLNGGYRVEGQRLRRLPVGSFWGSHWWPSTTGTVNYGYAVAPSNVKVVVNYDHGYLTVPDVVREVCVSAALRMFTNPTQEKSETWGDFTGVHNDLLTPAEVNALQNLAGSELLPGVA